MAHFKEEGFSLSDVIERLKRVGASVEGAFTMPIVSAEDELFDLAEREIAEDEITEAEITEAEITEDEITKADEPLETGGAEYVKVVDSLDASYDAVSVAGSEEETMHDAQEEAEPPSAGGAAGGAERRVAEDGGCYTKPEFFQYFGSYAEWDAAVPMDGAPPQASKNTRRRR